MNEQQMNDPGSTIRNKSEQIFNSKKIISLNEFNDIDKAHNNTLQQQEQQQPQQPSNNNNKSLDIYHDNSKLLCKSVNHKENKLNLITIVINKLTITILK